jgi:hypothetical protein
MVQGMQLEPMARDLQLDLAVLAHAIGSFTGHR